MWMKWAAVAMPVPFTLLLLFFQKAFYHPLLNDSKELTKEERNILRPIIEKECYSFSVASVTNVEIDRINILQASFKAMHLALNKLKTQPELLLVDGNRFKKYKKLPHQCMIKGDGMYAPIAAASVLAKCYRDEYMERLHEKHRVYLWNKNKGYGTREHRTAIEIHGLCRYHRKSFNIWPDFTNELETVIED